MSANLISVDDYEALLEKLEKSGSDAWGNIAETTLVAMAATAAGASAPLLFGALGLATATTTTLVPATLLGSTALASFFGLAPTVVATTVAVATPIGWFAALAAAGGAVTLALTRVVRSGGAQDERRERMKRDLRKDLDKMKRNVSSKDYDDQLRMVADILHTGSAQGRISVEFGSRLLTLLRNKEITPEYALNTIQNMFDLRDGKTTELHGDIVYSSEEKEAIASLKDVDKKEAISILENLHNGKIGFSDIRNKKYDVDSYLEDNLKILGDVIMRMAKSMR